LAPDKIDIYCFARGKDSPYAYGILVVAHYGEECKEHEKFGFVDAKTPTEANIKIILMALKSVKDDFKDLDITLHVRKSAFYCVDRTSWGTYRTKPTRHHKLIGAVRSLFDELPNARSKMIFSKYQKYAKRCIKKSRSMFHAKRRELGRYKGDSGQGARPEKAT